MMNRVRWHHFDGHNQVVGRLATRVATLIIGKHKPTYSPHLDHGDNVVITNVQDIAFTGRKEKQKIYRWHTGYNLRSTTPEYLRNFKGKPEEIIRRAVNGMLPKNNLRRIRMKRLYMFQGSDFPYMDKFSPYQQEQIMEALNSRPSTDQWLKATDYFDPFDPAHSYGNKQEGFAIMTPEQEKELLQFAKERKAEAEKKQE